MNTLTLIWQLRLEQIQSTSFERLVFWISRTYFKYFTFGTVKKTSKINWPSIHNLTEYDIHSIMHYDGTLRGHFTKPIMTNKITGKGIAINREMSPLDIQKLNKMYPCESMDPVCGKFLWECLTWFIFALDRASNQALEEEINRLNTEVNHLNVESRTIQNKLDFCESKNRNQAKNCKFWSFGDFW